MPGDDYTYHRLVDGELVPAPWDSIREGDVLWNGERWQEVLWLTSDNSWTGAGVPAPEGAPT